ncbi:unnamed protein product [Acanthoscelides obtectus]|uniref:Transposase n=1 Tax=Acanthoscelides obtectus TaxID=200917 RepID=A0A9P0LJC0_ACAOB|nr:unnamed protein product [Acanthoscelides obtectus]CAK1671846.1 hypothetical protein AOBTE_LOCUS28494 [Acanthoscelides obtectus]
MELNREHFRAIIYYNFQRQLSQQECLAELLSVFGNKAPHQIQTWTGEAVTQEYVDVVRKLIIEDRHVTYREIEASLKISKTSIQKNLHEELGVRKLVSRWIRHLLTEEQKATSVNWCQKTLDRFNSRNSKNVFSIVSGDESSIYCYESENKRQSAVWVVQCEEKPTKVMCSRSVSKKVVATFVSKAGHIATIPLNDGRKRGIIGPYSPDLSPNDFFTFPKIKNRLRGQRFQSPEEAVDAFKNAVLDLPANEWNKCFENWFEHMQMCNYLPGERRILRKTIKSFKTTYRVVLFPYAKLKRHPSYVYPHSNYSL